MTKRAGHYCDLKEVVGDKVFLISKNDPHDLVDRRDELVKVLWFYVFEFDPDSTRKQTSALGSPRTTG